MILRRVLLQILLAALLLAGQYSALTHGLRHWQSGQPVQSQQHDGGKSKSQSALCDFHVAFAEILGAVDAYAMPPAVVAGGAERAVEPYFFPAYAKSLVPASRGPPVLL